MRKTFLATLFIGLCTVLNAQNVNYYTPGTGEGVLYFLPKTLLQIDVVATKKVYTPGQLAPFAKEYLKTTVEKEATTTWELKDIQIQTIGIPDTTKVYTIRLKDKNLASNVDLTHNGIIKAINTTGQEFSMPQYTLQKSAPIENPKRYLTEEILLAGSPRKMAELTAKEIYAIRESRNNILRGNAETMPKDGASLQIIMDNLEKQEKALTQLFVGTEEWEETKSTYIITPDMEKEVVAFRFSKYWGAVEATDLSGEPYFLTIQPSLNMPTAPIEEGKRKRPEGIIYNIPGEAIVRLTKGNKVVYEQKHSFTQIGATEVLVEKLFDKKVNTRVQFHPATGAILKIEKDE